MSKPTKKNLSKVYDAKPETAMEKTTRVVRQMVVEEAAQRDAKNSRLRTARLEREASSPPETTAKPVRKTRRTETDS
ncbi:hypothetical protein [Sulfitobacter dubius]|uniref:hypothetical protein n=1 Tax=Sulfitobacter dubius TaxID=218673 RepID=UPI001113D981|nr:hypothetical protein [Sulfitobacter dubius]